MVRCGGVSSLFPQNKQKPPLPRKTDTRTSKTRFEFKDTNSVKHPVLLCNELQNIQEELIWFTGINICKQTQRGNCKLSSAGEQELTRNYHCFNLSYPVFTSDQLAASVQLPLHTAEHLPKQQQNQINLSHLMQCKIPTTPQQVASSGSLGCPPFRSLFKSPQSLRNKFTGNLD